MEITDGRKLPDGFCQGQSNARFKDDGRERRHTVTISPELSSFFLALFLARMIIIL